jgi:endogenous inhibitor of DNA gyrase (YacG/DUF329 family)
MPEHAIRRRCPICQKPAAEGFRPFCSKRCADVDLNRWLSGAYVVAGAPEDDDAPASDSRTGLTH